MRKKTELLVLTWVHNWKECDQLPKLQKVSWTPVYRHDDDVAGAGAEFDSRSVELEVGRTVVAVVVVAAADYGNDDSRSLDRSLVLDYLQDEIGCHRKRMSRLNQ